jgi:hypothetical protein
MAEKYFDDMNNDVQITGKRHQQKSVDGYNRLPEVFTTDDVVRCFGYKDKKGVYMKISRLEKDAAIMRIKEGENAGKFMKVKKMLA